MSDVARDELVEDIFCSEKLHARSSVGGIVLVIDGKVTLIRRVDRYQV